MAAWNRAKGRPSNPFKHGVKADHSPQTAGGDRQALLGRPSERHGSHSDHGPMGLWKLNLWDNFGPWDEEFTQVPSPPSPPRPPRPQGPKAPRYQLPGVLSYQTSSYWRDSTAPSAVEVGHSHGHPAVLRCQEGSRVAGRWAESPTKRIEKSNHTKRARERDIYIKITVLFFGGMINNSKKKWMQPTRPLKKLVYFADSFSNQRLLLQSNFFQK